MPFPVLPLFIRSKRQHGIRAGRDEGFSLIFALDSSKSLRAGMRHGGWRNEKPVNAGF
ncbi:hypothetical protein HMPREF3038_00046 [Akkermansia sp. KLE1797]|nr:hypothetical protein HMPREF3038_00046 [Akkermansia sp. KLE1797]KXU55701.1 hypothetical protein HMPREF3039_00054 [Akkermansia sp. KLE1798]KZA05254.1 hypothetical protein HMPREF1326_01014 [Akkermansia sp. KLE1605]